MGLFDLPRPIMNGVPGHHSHSPIRTRARIWFTYDFYPIMIEYRDTRPSLFGCLTNIMAACAGIYALAKITDGLLFHATKDKGD